ncbi:hypothetical protein MPSEU_001011000 [Mayamaea pseudoterrestris]|nr:hypothetical protein MPSEU_001011000 [Mayamaea pseudoterrestris]
MGCCTSCLDAISGRSSNDTRQSETELRTTSASSSSDDAKSLSVSRAMSAPTIDLHDRQNARITGYGLAIVGVSIEQDSAYWEVHVDMGKEGSAPMELLVGVSLKRDRAFFKAMEDTPAASQVDKGTEMMRNIKVKHGDTIGVAVQQDDLPMIQFLLNGEPLHDISINKFRGSVYPSIFLPENDGLSARFVFAESSFKEMPPGARFGPLIIARGII